MFDWFVDDFLIFAVVFSKTVQLKLETENFEHQEQAIVDNFVNALGKRSKEKSFRQ